MAIMEITSGPKAGWTIVHLSRQKYNEFLNALGDQDLDVLDYMLDTYGSLPDTYIINVDNEDMGGEWDCVKVFQPYPEPHTMMFYFRHADAAMRFKLQWG